MLFAYFKRTLDYLQRQRTSHGIRATLIHGDVPQKDRQKRIRKFWEEPDLTVLLSSEVGGEGIDLQVANVLVNYDLPWNPMRAEQRIGRLDRFGLTHEKILIYNFSMKGSLDDIILSWLYNRINNCEQYIGDLEAILGDRINELTREMVSPDVTEKQQRQKADQISENLVRERNNLERFEDESEKFIGQDEFFTRDIQQDS